MPTVWYVIYNIRSKPSATNCWFTLVNKKFQPVQNESAQAEIHGTMVLQISLHFLESNQQTALFRIEAAQTQIDTDLHGHTRQFCLDLTF